MKKLKLGDCVLWKAPIPDGQKTSPVFPAFIWGIYEDNILALTILEHGNPTRKAYVAYGKNEPERWMFHEDAA